MKAFSCTLITSLFFLSFSCADTDFLAGHNKRALFAPATTAEIDEVLVDWSTRDLSAKDYEIEQSTEISTRMVLKIVSFRVGGYKEYGALLVPDQRQIFLCECISVASSMAIRRTQSFLKRMIPALVNPLFLPSLRSGDSQ